MVIKKEKIDLKKFDEYMREHGMIIHESGYVGFEKPGKGLEFLIGSVIFGRKEKRKKVVFYLEKRSGKEKGEQYYARVYISSSY